MMNEQKIAIQNVQMNPHPDDDDNEQFGSKGNQW